LQPNTPTKIGFNSNADFSTETVANHVHSGADADDAARWRELKRRTLETEQKRGCTASTFGQPNWLLNHTTMTN